MGTTNNRGFTLLELLISVVISGIIVVMASQALKMGLMNTEKGADKFERNLRNQAIRNLTSRQISTMFAYKIDSQETLYFIGSRDQMMFVTPFSLTDHYRKGLVLVSYQVQSDDGNQQRLICWEMPLLDEESLRKLRQAEHVSFPESNKQEISLFLHCDVVSFDFLDKTDGKETLKWVTEWKENYLPRAVRVTIEKKDHTSIILVPITVMS